MNLTDLTNLAEEPDISNDATQNYVQSLLNRLAAKVGAFNYLFVARERDADGCPERIHLIVGDEAERFAQVYTDRRWFMIDPHLQHAEHHSAPSWGWPDALTSGQRDMKDCWERMISSGFAVFPAHGPWQNITGALYLGFQTADATMPKSLHATRHAVRSLSVEVLQWLMGRIYRRELGDVKFSNLDIEILRLEKLGCTARETADALQESPSRIDRAIRSLNMRLHTTSKKQAAHRAAMAGVLP